MREAEDLTELLLAWRAGDASALDDLMPLVYGELRKRAFAQLRDERHCHTLQPTALVHETFLKLAENDQVSWQSRLHFLAFAGRLMRRILVDSARARQAKKRPGSRQRVPLREDLAAVDPNVDVLDLDRALARLQALDERQAKVVELRYFAGMTVSETAELLELSRATVKREWTAARAWLYYELQRGDA